MAKRDTDNGATVFVGNLVGADQIVRVVVDGPNGRYALIANSSGLTFRDSTHGRDVWTINP